MLNRESCQKSEKDFCFATLALGKKYRVLALLLAEDLEKYSPNTSFVILTDNPREFSGRSNVLAFKHRQQGVKCWHDKRFVLAKAHGCHHYARESMLLDIKQSNLLTVV